ncbi:MAG: hypothetical protein K5771_03140 [Oscillospiraceae bacterium]|nr:hypothetical protein [Oscillospiraceae bacterium]
MRIIDWLILAGVAALIVIAVRVWIKSGSCSCSSGGSCCGNCSACSMNCCKKEKK